jgi:hypothetical protein
MVRLGEEGHVRSSAASMDGSQEQDASTRYPPVDNCALRQLRIHEYDCRILRNRFSRLASATVGFWQDVCNGPLGRLVTGAEYEYIRRGRPSTASAARLRAPTTSS